MNKLVLLSALMIAIIGTIGTVSAAEPLTVDLIADGGDEMTAFPVGVVEVTNDDEYLYVTYTTTNGWCMTETHLQVATLGVETPAEGIPQTKKNNPIPGKFDNSTDYDPCTTTSVEYTIPIPEGYEAGDDVIIAAHTAVQLFEDVDPDTGEDIFRYESAWGEGDNFEGKNWAMYFTYTIPSATLPPA